MALAEEQTTKKTTHHFLTFAAVKLVSKAYENLVH